MVSYRLIGTDITDSNGIATCNYTGSGKGEVDFVASTDNASHISESSILSETYNIWDTLFWDKGHSGTDGVDYNSTGWSNARCTLTRDTETTIVWTGESSNGSYYRSLSDDTGICIELDINYAKYRGTDVLFSLLNTWSTIKSVSRTDLGLAQNTWHHLKIELNGANSTITNTTDDTVITFDSTDTNRFLLSLNHANDVIMYKNFKIYSI